MCLVNMGAWIRARWGHCHPGNAERYKLGVVMRSLQLTNSSPKLWRGGIGALSDGPLVPVDMCVKVIDVWARRQDQQESA